jgi:hypothetical protein
MEAVGYGYNIQWIDNPSEEIQLKAVIYAWDVIKLIKNPSESVKIAAVKHCGYAIQLIENPSEAVQLEAVKQEMSCHRFIHKPHQNTLKFLRENYDLFDSYFEVEEE